MYFELGSSLAGFVMSAWEGKKLCNPFVFLFVLKVSSNIIKVDRHKRVPSVSTEAQITLISYPDLPRPREREIW